MVWAEAHTLGPSFAAIFPGSIARSWIWSGETGTQTGTNMGYHSHLVKLDQITLVASISDK